MTLLATLNKGLTTEACIHLPITIQFNLSENLEHALQVDIYSSLAVRYCYKKPTCAFF